MVVLVAADADVVVLVVVPVVGTFKFTAALPSVVVDVAPALLITTVRTVVDGDCCWTTTSDEPVPFIWADDAAAANTLRIFIGVCLGVVGVVWLTGMLLALDDVVVVVIVVGLPFKIWTFEPDVWLESTILGPDGRLVLYN